MKKLIVSMKSTEDMFSDFKKVAKIIDRDLSNIKKIVYFFEEIGALEIKEEKISGRTVKKPVVNYDRAEFDLKTAQCRLLE